MSDGASALPVYRGRFAPSPSGPLHAGSLVAAVGSYLDAKAHDGNWLVRMEDIDPPREPAGAADTILQQLEAHHLFWDESVLWQSKQYGHYASLLEKLKDHQRTYYCDCTRKQIRARSERYDGYCRNRNVAADKSAVRFRNDHPVTQFDDWMHQSVSVDNDFANEDFILRRRDGLWAYQLAVVHDDFFSGITHIVRGEDLLEASAWQLTLWNALNEEISEQKRPLPHLCHLPLVMGADGRKLSKQNHAPALSTATPQNNLIEAFSALQLDPPNDLKRSSLDDILQWGVNTWREKQQKSERKND